MDRLEPERLPDTVRTAPWQELTRRERLRQESGAAARAALW
jgi:hypothetical protein